MPNIEDIAKATSIGSVKKKKDYDDFELSTDDYREEDAKSEKAPTLNVHPTQPSSRDVESKKAPKKQAEAAKSNSVFAEKKPLAPAPTLQLADESLQLAPPPRPPRKKGCCCCSIL